MNRNTTISTTSILLTSLWMAGVANAALLTDPNDTRDWQGATVGTFASLIYGSDTFANRQQVINDQLLDDGLWSDPSGFSLGSYVQGADSMGGTPDPTVLNWNGATVNGTFAGNANARDFFWVQDSGNAGNVGGAYGGRPSQGIVWDLGGQANQAVVFVQVDHGPLPLEVMENTAWLSNDPNASDSGWTQASASRIYLEGWSPNLNHISDGFTVVYTLPVATQTFQYVSVSWEGPGSLGATGGENEIDAVGGLTAQGTGVPEPASILILGLGLIGLGFSRMRATA